MIVAPDFAAAIAERVPALAALADPARICLLLADTLCSALAAEAVSAGTGNVVSRSGLAAFAAGGSANLWSGAGRGSLEAAALRNGVAVRYLDFNDTYVGRIIVHPSDMVAALVALAEVQQAGWRRLIEAVSVAYDVLCLMADQSETRKNGFDPATLVPIAVAAGGAWLIGLDAAKTSNALRLAALDAGVLRCIRLGKIADWRAVAAARNAVKGLFAIEMAALGTEGPPGTFEADDGFFAHVSGVLGLDEKPVSRVGKALTKSYPAQIFIQPMLDLAADLHAKLAWRGPEVASVVIGTNSEAIRMIGPRPGNHKLNRETADHSAAFCTAAMLLTGRFGPGDLDGHLRDSAVLALARKIALTVEEGSDFPNKLPTSIRVTLADGTQTSRRYDAPRPPDVTSLRRKLDALWPADRARDWAWELPGERPVFPGA